jgi:hypothetical protein
MNNVKQVDNLITDLKNKIIALLVSASAACWELCLACIGWSYVYSAWGAECTPSQRKYRFNLCPTKTTIKSKCQVLRDNNPKPNCNGCQWFPEGERTRCFDCRGFTNWILKILLGFVLYGDTVKAQWNHADNWCVKGQFGVDPIPQNVLVNIFIKKDGKWTHTGFYYNGSTCECSVGVQYHETMVKNRWTHWAIAACFANGYQLPTEPDKEPEKEPVKEPDKGDQTVSKKTIRRGDKGDLVRECQTMLKKLGYDLGKYGVDGDFGQATEKAVKAFQKAHKLSQDGVVGPKTWDALQKAVDAQAAPPPVVYYDVTVTHVTKAVADEIVGKYGGKIVAE